MQQLGRISSKFKENQTQNSPFHYPELPVETTGHVKDNTSKLSGPFMRGEKRKLATFVVVDKVDLKKLNGVWMLCSLKTSDKEENFT